MAAAVKTTAARCWMQRVGARGSCISAQSACHRVLQRARAAASPAAIGATSARTTTITTARSLATSSARATISTSATAAGSARSATAAPILVVESQATSLAARPERVLAPIVRWHLCGYYQGGGARAAGLRMPQRFTPAAAAAVGQLVPAAATTVAIASNNNYNYYNYTNNYTNTNPSAETAAAAEASDERRRASASVVCLAAAPLCVVPAALMPGSMAESQFRWIFESLVGSGSVTMGLPGLVSLGIFFTPMVEAMPRIRRQGCVGKMPLLPYSAMASMGLVWTVYGLMIANPAVWTPNLCATFLGLYYSWVYSRYCPPGADWLPFRLPHHALGFVATAAVCLVASLCLPTESALTVLGLTGNLMTVIMFGGPLASIRTVISEQSTRSMALGFTCIINLNCNFWFFYAYFMMNDPFIYIQDGLGLVLTTLQLALFARYGVHR
ncbi:unnamed protein product [Polarella glacialis]|uniref:Sugar transporter SWEET1 n=1 Tax=Polarella glacialis TaxID=89957 RepID=A0A813F050_POLGL|nr:unnamed protein product [Polarella glacialis]